MTVPEDWQTITPEQVLTFNKPADGYLCPLSANTVGLDFLEFEIKDYDTNKVVFKVVRDPSEEEPLPEYISPAVEDMIRTVKYTFPKEFLGFDTVRTSLVFCVGDKPLNNFRMIERHYFEDKLLRSYDFNFGFVIPNSKNSWEAIYPLPKNDKAKTASMIKSQGGHTSDSFYFVDNKLVMHNKAVYRYVD